MPPLTLAEIISNELIKMKVTKVKDVKIAGLGFINFFLNKNFYISNLKVL